MNGIVFEWDRGKDAINVRKHGVGFADASTVFADPLSITISDPVHSGSEDRLVIVGLSGRQELLVVIHTIREEKIRLISARAATKQERRQYEESFL